MLHEVIASHLEDARIASGSYLEEFEVRTTQEISNDALIEVIQSYYTKKGQIVRETPVPMGFQVREGDSLVGWLTITNATTGNKLSRKVMGSFIPHRS